MHTSPLKHLTVRAPFDATPIGEVALSSEHDVERAIETAYRLHRDRRAWLPAAQRIEILRRAAAIFSSRREALALQVARESGKPLRDARIEVDRGIDGVHIAIEQLRSDAGHVVPMQLNATSSARVAFTQYEPIGPVLGISAFNHPFNLVIHQVVPALAVGAPALVKPSPRTPLSCDAILDVLTEAGLPPGWMQRLLPDSNERVAALAADPRVAFLSFIGSAAVGWRLRSQLAPGARCALEHGGVAPVIVAADADLDSAIPRIAHAAFWHAGQACVSVQRVFCDVSIARDVAERIAIHGASMKIGDPTDASTDLGPLISPDEADRISSWVDEAVAGGARLVGGGQRLSASGYAPTVLLDPPHDAKVSRLEVFGPVVCVYSCTDLDKAVAQANALPYSFQAAVFTRSLDTAMRCYRFLDGTAVMVNESTLFRVDWMPFAGARLSGHGVGGIPHSMREMQVEKMMVWRSEALA